MSITVEDVAGTSYTLQASDDGKIKRFTAGSAVAITCPDTLLEGFECVLTQAGAGQLTCSPSGTATFLNKGDVKSRKINAYIAVTAEQDAVYKFNGELSIATTLVKANYAAVTDPGINDDDTQGYTEGSRWFNLSALRVFECLDSTTGAAVWKKSVMTTAEQEAVSKYQSPLVNEYNFDTGLTDVDPGSGEIAFNNATLASVTKIFASETDSKSNSVLNVLEMAQEGDILYWESKADPTNNARFTLGTITDNTNYFTFDVTLVVSNGAVLSASDPCILQIIPSGAGAGSSKFVDWTFTEDSSYVSTTSTIPEDNTIPQNTEGTEYTALNTTYTPKDAGNKLLVEVYLPLVCADTNYAIAALFRDSGADAIAVSSSSSFSAGITDDMYIMVIVDAGSTSPTTFKLRYGPQTTGNMYIGGDNSQLFSTAKKAYIKVTELKP